MKVSKSTDATGLAASDVVSLPEALPLTEAQRVPGVLGRITVERTLAYQAVAPPTVSLAEGGALAPRASFLGALREPGLAIIAEVKRKSPSLGAIADLEPLAAAQAYVRGGAAALSVLTEPNHFGGDLGHLQQVAAGVSLPLLRKDFTVHPAQLFEARAAGASAVLLIVAVLGARLGDYLKFAQALGLDALVEVHDEAELELALTQGAVIVGVNNRDLKTLVIDLETSPRLMQRARDTGFSGVLIAESGYREAAQLGSVLGLADAVLVGSSLAGSGDLERALAQLRRGLAALGADA